LKAEGLIPPGLKAGRRILGMSIEQGADAGLLGE
jgi:hypothetical protein